jgi:uncharacterized membrane protein YecN with MAPEG domain
MVSALYAVLGALLLVKFSFDVVRCAPNTM